MQPILQSHSPSVLTSTVTFHQRSLPGGGGTLPGKDVRFTEDRLHKHCCTYSCAKKRLFFVGTFDSQNYL